MLCIPTQLSTQGQWWSIPKTQSSQIEQWWDFMGFMSLHFEHCFWYHDQRAERLKFQYLRLKEVT